MLSAPKVAAWAAIGLGAQGVALGQQSAEADPQRESLVLPTRNDLVWERFRQNIPQANTPPRLQLGGYGMPEPLAEAQSTLSEDFLRRYQLQTTAEHGGIRDVLHELFQQTRSAILAERDKLSADQRERSALGSPLDRPVSRAPALADQSLDQALAESRARVRGRIEGTGQRLEALGNRGETEAMRLADEAERQERERVQREAALRRLEQARQLLGGDPEQLERYIAEVRRQASDSSPAHVAETPPEGGEIAPAQLIPAAQASIADLVESANDTVSQRSFSESSPPESDPGGVFEREDNVSAMLLNSIRPDARVGLAQGLIYTAPGYEHLPIIYIPGITTTAADAAEQAEELSRATGRPVIPIVNDTFVREATAQWREFVRDFNEGTYAQGSTLEQLQLKMADSLGFLAGWSVDAIKTTFDRFGPEQFASEAATYSAADLFYRRVVAGQNVDVAAHSGGTTIAANALLLVRARLLSEVERGIIHESAAVEALARMNVVASGAFMPEHEFPSEINLTGINDRRDPIAMLGGWVPFVDLRSVSRESHRFRGALLEQVAEHFRVKPDTP